MLIVVAAVGLLILMVAALSDLVGPTDRYDQAGRMILAISILLIPPVGLLAYASTRPGVGRAIATVAIAGTGVFIVAMVATGLR
jgi:putative effector of murein hydrolase LrgA (UPF0299 family)